MLPGTSARHTARGTVSRAVAAVATPVAVTVVAAVTAARHLFAGPHGRGAGKLVGRGAGAETEVVAVVLVVVVVVGGVAGGAAAVGAARPLLLQVLLGAGDFAQEVAHREEEGYEDHGGGADAERDGDDVGGLGVVV